MILYLNDKKVLKYFGQRPWLGRRVRGKTKTVTVGVRFNIHLIDKDGNQGDFEPDDNVNVDVCIALKPAGKGKWEVVAAPEHQQFAENWLLDNCAI